MAMWTEYEGTTIGTGFPLTKLLQPEGRSALFSTVDEKGSRKVLRLIESHFDEDEILTRWKAVAALNHPHLLPLENYGKFTEGETVLVYAVMEPADANLGEVLGQQRLTLPETRQLAESMASALEALHSHGLIHEHVVPASILAVGEIVKLRSDCIREAPEGSEGRALKQRDIQNLSTVLLMALTQQRTLETAGFLPAPFDRIIPRGLRGELELSELTATFKPAPAASVPTAPVVSAPVVSAPAVSAAPASTAPVVATPATASPAAAKPVTAVPVVTPPVVAAPVTAASVAAEKSSEQRWVPPTERAAKLADDAHPGTPSPLRPMVMAGGALIVLLILWLGWRIFHHPAHAPVPVAQTATVPPAPAPASPVPRPAAAHPAAAPAPPSTTAADTHKGWRVIAYTYNREDQARHKAETVGQQHPGLHPQVFTPTGRTPYFVALGSVMSQDQAFAVAAQAHREGLPHDVYARHYR